MQMTDKYLHKAILYTGKKKINSPRENNMSLDHK